MSLDIRVSNLHLDTPARSAPPVLDYQILLWIVCDVVVVARDREVYCEIDLTPVELAEQVAEWLRAGADTDFDFVSMESEIRGLLYFHRDEDAGWSVGSNVPEAPSAVSISDGALRLGAERFLAALPVMLDELGVDVRHLLEGTRVLAGPLTEWRSPAGPGSIHRRR